MEYISKPGTSRVLFPVLIALLAPIYYGYGGIFPFIPAFVTIAAWVVASVFHLPWPLLSTASYHRWSSVLAGFGGLVTIALLLFRQPVAYPIGILAGVSWVCLTSFRRKATEANAQPVTS